MRIGGLVPFTTIDYPGELAAVVFCQGCPWRCSYCHNPHLLPGDSARLLEWEAVFEALAQRRRFLDAVVFSGGEPCAQKDLAGAIAEIKSLGYKAGLHTAGAYPRRLQQLLPMLDWVGLDIKELPEHYPVLTGAAASGYKAWESLALIQAAGIPFQVRTTLYPDMPDSHVDRLCARLKEMAIEDHVLQSCRPPPPSADTTPQTL
ncbi:anaerobic ribonucleoside-triphosphate reductase activating protein [Thiolapillus sp.]